MRKDRVAPGCRDDYSLYKEKVLKLGGKVLMPKTAVHQMGYFAVCQDTENNTFAIWEKSESAK